jgi:hypothetical protein
VRRVLHHGPCNNAKCLQINCGVRAVRSGALSRRPKPTIWRVPRACGRTRASARAAAAETRFFQASLAASRGVAPAQQRAWRDALIQAMTQQQGSLPVSAAAVACPRSCRRPRSARGPAASDSHTVRTAPARRMAHRFCRHRRNEPAALLGPGCWPGAATALRSNGWPGPTAYLEASLRRQPPRPPPTRSERT